MTQPLTIKELTETVGNGVTPRMVRHYHAIGLLPPPRRSEANYRLYDQQDVQRLRRIVALKQQGFQLAHIHQLLDDSSQDFDRSLMAQLQQQYRTVMRQLTRLRQTAFALEGLLGRDRHCQTIQAEALAQLKQLEVHTQDGIADLEKLWDSLDAETTAHPEAFQESLNHLLPDLSRYSEVTVDLLHKLVLASGDVSLVQFVRLSAGAVVAARDALKTGCAVVADVPLVVAALDQPRLAHLGCAIEPLIADCHISSAVEAEQAFWQNQTWRSRLAQLAEGSVLVVGYAPSVLLAACAAIEQGDSRPALVVGMPLGFSHAPAAKRRLMRCGVPYLTIDGTIGGGLLAAFALNAFAESLIEKPDCHCYLTNL